MNRFPGGTAVSQLAVYDWAGPDGHRGGSAHVHLACTEGYVVLGGRGRLQTLGPEGFAETPLTPMTVAWFSPGIIHRLINDGDLRILVVMQNGGLPEAGDAVLTFPPDRLADPAGYRSAAGLPDAADPEEAAHRRRDLALEGFLQLRDRVEAEGIGALDDFYAAAVALVKDRVPDWWKMWRQNALAAAQQTGDHLDQLALGNHRHLWDGRLGSLPPPQAGAWGMCGRLTQLVTPDVARDTP